MDRRMLSVLTALCLMIVSSISMAGGDAAAAAGTVPLCMGCHGSKGEGRQAGGGQPAFPRLAGQIESYLIQAINDYKNDVRSNPAMKAISKGLSDTQISNIAAYYATLK